MLYLYFWSPHCLIHRKTNLKRNVRLSEVLIIWIPPAEIADNRHSTVHSCSLSYPVCAFKKLGVLFNVIINLLAMRRPFFLKFLKYVFSLRVLLVKQHFALQIVSIRESRYHYHTFKSTIYKCKYHKQLFSWTLKQAASWTPHTCMCISFAFTCIYYVKVGHFINLISDHLIQHHKESWLLTIPSDK